MCLADGPMWIGRFNFIGGAISRKFESTFEIQTHEHLK